MAKDKIPADTSASGSGIVASGSTSTNAPKNMSPANVAAMTQQDAIFANGIENYELPKSLVTRISKSALPDNAKLQKDTVVALVKGSTVFINYLAATAHDIATSRQHRSVSASDVIRALEIIQFGDMVPGLQEELEIFRENARSSRKSKPGDSRSKGKSRAGGASAATSKSLHVPIEVLTTSNKSDTPLTLDVDEDMTPADELDDQLARNFNVTNGVKMNGFKSADVDTQSNPADEDEDEEDELLSDAGDEEDERGVDDDVDEIIDDDDDDVEDDEKGHLEDSMQVEENDLRRDSRDLDVDEDGFED